MPSCSSNSSNILSGFSSLNISQGSGGSRLIVSIPRVQGLTVGNVVRYDVATSGYTASKADSEVNAEVFGVVESYIPSGDKLAVVMNGSINLPDSYLANKASDPSGGGGGNDIYFLSGLTAGLLENLVPDNPNHVVKPIYQRAPHGTYTGSVVNYSGYKLGGLVQSTVDSKSLYNRIGTLQFAFEDLFAFTGVEQLLLEQYMNGIGTDIPPLFQLDPDTPKDWNLEFLRIDRDGIGSAPVLRPIDFQKFLGKLTNSTGNFVRYGPGWNWTAGWFEKIKIDEGVAFPNLTISHFVFQFNHGQYQNTPLTAACYGQVWAWDSVNRYIWVFRPATQLFDPAQGNPNASNYRIDHPQMYEIQQTNGSGGTISIGTLPGNDPLTLSNWTLSDYTIRTTNRNTQFVAMKMVSLIWNVNFVNTPNTTGFFQVYSDLQDLINPTGPLLNYFTSESLNPSVYVKVDDRGSSVNIPQQVSINNIVADVISLGTIGDLKAKIDNIEQRLSNGNL